jgi:peptidoglycan/LPS O-acetylase OafA/YrhL
MMTLGLAAMFYGAVLRNYLLEKQTELKIPLILLTVFYFVCLVAAQKFYYKEGWVSWFNTQLFSFALFYLLVTKVKLTHKFFIYIGRISYSLYLLNALVIGLVFYVFGDFAFTSIGFYVVLLSTFIASIFVADLSYRFIEKPGLSLSKRYVFRPTNT